MFNVLFKTINQKVKLTEEEQELSKQFFIPRKLRKKQYLLQQNDVCKYSAFIKKGILRTYTVDDKGDEHIVQFALEGWWIADLYSIISGEPSIYNIDVVDDATLLLLTREANEELLFAIPKMERYFRLLTQNALIAMQRRLVGNLSESAEEKYDKMITNYPEIIQKGFLNT